RIEDYLVASIETKSLDRPDESRTPEKTTLNVVHLGDATVARLTVQPGWRWSECIKPVVGTQSCEAAHLGYVVSGKLHVASNDGAEVDLSAGDSYRLDPGHEAWVVGDEPFVALEFESKTAATYAKS
ncbi:MAG TPA: cupin domain-containing protein, partial [Frankiaceae bacterium]|nr:cupin domain-containing protein [Frankiaceae bacterium]